MADRWTQKIDNLERALDALKTSLEGYQKFPDARAFRDSVMLNFMLTHELAVKQLARYIKTQTTEGQDPNQLTMKDLLRVAARYGLVVDVQRWFDYGQARNNVVHVYDEQKALTVSASVPQFYEDACFLLKQLQTRLKEVDEASHDDGQH